MVPTQFLRCACAWLTGVDWLPLYERSSLPISPRRDFCPRLGRGRQIHFPGPNVDDDAIFAPRRVRADKFITNVAQNRFRVALNGIDPAAPAGCLVLKCVAAPDVAGYFRSQLNSIGAAAKRVAAPPTWRSAI